MLADLLIHYYCIAHNSLYPLHIPYPPKLNMDKVSSQLSSSSPSPTKLSVADLKAYLKNAGVTFTGDKGTLWWRCQTHHTVVSIGLVTADGDIPTKLKTPQLRKAAAKVGVSPIGSSDEMLEGLVAYLTKEQSRKNDGSTTSASDLSSSSSSGKSNATKPKPKGPALAEAVLSLADAALISPIRILQLSDPTLEPTSPTADLRKAYLKLSLHIHPDRIGKEFREATKAFQVLVTAYETLTSPDYLPSDEPQTKKGKKKAAQISRSNEGCFRTQISCPRCNTRWGDKVEGNPEWYYNVMMQGLKSFHCATCLLKFGCMSAKHSCPSCRKPVAYSPSDYHRKITCTSPQCKKPFGFFMYHMSDLALRNLREEILQTRDEFTKKMAALKRRSKRAERDADDELDLKAFCTGLADECPKCGVDLSELKEEGISAEVHLMNCTDEKAHTKQKAKRAAKRKKVEANEEAQTLQNDAESKAAWDFLGKSSDQLYLLNEGQLQKELKEKGLESKAGDDKADMIAALVNKERSLVVRDGSAGKGGGMSASSGLPSMSTLQRMDVDELRAVLASHGMGGGKLKGMTKREMLHLLEEKVYKNDDDAKEVKLLTNGDDHGRKKPAKKRKKKAIEIDSSDDDGDWKPDA